MRTNLYPFNTEDPNHPFVDLTRLGNALRISFALFDKDGHIVYMNKSFGHDCGVDPDEAIGKTEDFILEAIDSPILPDVFNYKRMICRPIRKNDMFMFIAAIPSFDQDGNVVMVGMSIQNEESLNEVRYNFEKLTQNNVSSIQITENIDRETEILRTLQGNHRSIRELKNLINQIGPSDASVLITGETGTGKEVVADCLQALSKRNHQPYVKINCAAIPSNLLESELFGYEPGAFTGAGNKSKAGLLETANHGTVFLDEIGDMPIELQPKLLRALQHGEVFRLGSTTARKTDVRIIAATNVDINDQIAQGNFREDLYYRLAVIPIFVPPLRMRRTDILPLTRYYLDLFCNKYQKKVMLPSQTLDLLTQYDWPGNIRELQNVIEYYVVCSQDEEGLDVDNLRKALRQPISSMNSKLGDGTLQERMEAYEKHLLEEFLASGKSLRQVARLLDVDPSTLSRKAKKYDIHLYTDR